MNEQERPLDKRVRIERPVTTNVNGRNVPVWTLVAVVYANVRDTPPSRSEAVRNGLQVARNQTTVQFAFRTDVDTTMRILYRDRVMQIVGGPAEIGHNWRCEVVAETVKI